MLCLTYVCGLLSILACDAIGGEIPLTMLTGETQDISPWTKFHFWEEVYYAMGDSLDYAASTRFPSNSSEGKGNFVGVSYSIGDIMTFKILTQDTKRLVYRSLVRSAKEDLHKNLRADKKVRVETVDEEEEQGEALPTSPELDALDQTPKVLKEPVNRKPFGNQDNDPRIIDPNDIIGQTYLDQSDTDGTRARMKIVELILDHQDLY